jgi:hypothetical protein
MTTSEMLAYLMEMVAEGSLSPADSVVALVRNAAAPLDSDEAFGQVSITEARLDEDDGRVVLVTQPGELLPALSVEGLRAALDALGAEQANCELYGPGDFQEGEDGAWTWCDVPIIATIPNPASTALGVVPYFEGFEEMFQ